MTADEYNVWAQEQNKKPGQHAQYYLSEPMPGGGTSSVKDPYYSSPEYLNSASSPYGEAPAEASLMWSSASPNDLMYGSSGSWAPLTEDVLVNDPNMLNAFNKGVTTPGVSQSAYTAFQTGLSPETQAQIAGLSGSSHSVAPDVGGEEELSRLLSGMWTPPNPVKANQPPPFEVKPPQGY